MRKPISQVRARVNQAHVVLTWYKSTPTFQAKDEKTFASFRIYRLETNDFVFGRDYEEFFFGLSHTSAQLVFEGPLSPTNNRKYTYTDEHVETGSTYAYFIQATDAPIVGPVPVRVRDPEIWWSYHTLQTRIQELANIAPDHVKITTCGHTSAGRNIFCLNIGQGTRTLGLVGLIHAGESGPELIVPALKTLLQIQPELFDHVRVVAIPGVNLDAREQEAEGTPWYLRTTPGGVDINRNFPSDWQNTEYGYGLDSSDPDAITFRGYAPICASETQAIINTFTQTPPDVLFAYHSLASICGMPALGSHKGQNNTAYTSKCETFVRQYALGLFPEMPFDPKWLYYGTSAGSLPAWLYDLGGIPAFDLEARHNSPEAPCIIDQTNRTLLADYQQRHTRAIANVLKQLSL